MQSALPHVSTVMGSPKSEPPSKRKRGRPPIDDYDQSFMTPRIASVSGNAEEGYSNDAMSTSENDLSIWEDDGAGNDQDDNGESDEPPRIKVKTELVSFWMMFLFVVSFLLRCQCLLCYVPTSYLGIILFFHKCTLQKIYTNGVLKLLYKNKHNIVTVTRYTSQHQVL